MPALTQFKLRRGTAAAWTSANPTLAAGEPGYETDTGKLKIGDGSTAWNSLGYWVSGAPSIVTSLPSSPGNGDEVYYKVGSGDTAVLWHLKYDSSITDSYKWRVIGAVSLQADVHESETTTSTSYTDLTTVGPSVTVPLAGVYEITFGNGAYNNTDGSDGISSVALGASVASDNDSIKIRYSKGSSAISVANIMRATPRKTLAANDVVKMKYRAGTSGIAGFFDRWLIVRPIRVG